MQTPRDILADLWTLGGGDPAALEFIALTGAEPILPSSFRVGVAAQVTVAAAGLAAAEIWRARSGEMQTVSVDMLHAATECRSERYLRVDDKPTARSPDLLQKSRGVRWRTVLTGPSLTRRRAESATCCPSITH